jgi:hypothetical protein
MVTQVVFRTDPKVKKKVMTRIRQDGITLQAFLNSCMFAYSKGEIIMGVIPKGQQPEIEVEYFTKTELQGLVRSGKKSYEKISSLID